MRKAASAEVEEAAEAGRRGGRFVGVYEVADGGDGLMAAWGYTCVRM